MKKTCSTCKQFLGFLGSEADKKYGFVSRNTCAKGALPKFVTHISEDRCEGFYSCDEWEERKPTNADMIRAANDEELLRILLGLISREVACADCFRKTGEKRLRVWLSLEVVKQ